jgi:NAD(P)H dehydrogenase (quinone)
MKTILIINGHPKSGSFCSALAQAYAKGALAAEHQVETITVADLKFDYNQMNGFNSGQVLEPDLQMAQQKLAWANHIVVVHPVWWGSVPAALKAFFDRVLLSGFAFKYKEKGPWWDKLLKGRSARIIYTSDTPSWFYKWIYGEPSVNQIKKRTLDFCGIKPVKVTAIGQLRFLNEQQRKAWLKKVEALGRLAN